MGDLEWDRFHVRRALTFGKHAPVLGPREAGRGEAVLYPSGDVVEVLAERREQQAMERDVALR